MTDGVTIYIEDTGYTELTDFTTRFPKLADATATEKLQGEFRADNRVALKVTNVNFGISNNKQITPNTSLLTSKYKRTSVSPLTLSLTAYLERPKSYSGTDDKDLPNLTDLAVMTLSKGHVDLYFDGDASVLAHRELFSLWQYMLLFGRADTGNTNTRQHLNVSLDSMSHNENINSSVVSVNLTFTILELDI